MTTTSRSARYAKWLSIPLGLAISALLIWQASYAAFTDAETMSATAGAATVDVELGDVATMATFDATNLLPGESKPHVVTAKYSGTVDADVSFYAEPLPAESILAPYLDLEIFATVPAGSFGSPAVTRQSIFSGPLTKFVSEHGASNTKFKAVAKPGDSTTLEFIITLRSDAANAPEVMGQTVQVDFVGSARGKH